MFKALHRCARTAARHEHGPAARTRLAYLEHLAAGGSTLQCLRANAGVLDCAAASMCRWTRGGWRWPLETEASRQRKASRLPSL